MPIPASPVTSASCRRPEAAARQADAQLAERRVAADEPAAVGGRRERRGPGDRGQRRLGRVRRALAAHQPGVHRHRARPRRRAELVAQEPPQVVERAHGLGVVAAGLVDLHEQPVPGLAERRGRDERARGALRDRERTRAQARLGEALERLDPHRLELAAALLDPRALEAGKERAPVRAERRRGVPGGGRPVAGDARGRGARGGRLGRLDVDPHRLLQRELGIAAPGRHPVAERLAQLGQQRRQRRLDRRGRPLGPQEVDEVRARGARGAAVEQVGEQQPALAAGEGALERAPAVHDAQRPAEADRPAGLGIHGRDATGARRARGACPSCRQGCPKVGGGRSILRPRPMDRSPGSHRDTDVAGTGDGDRHGPAGARHHLFPTPRIRCPARSAPAGGAPPSNRLPDQAPRPSPSLIDRGLLPRLCAAAARAAAHRRSLARVPRPTQAAARAPTRRAPARRPRRGPRRLRSPPRSG